MLIILRLWLFSVIRLGFPQIGETVVFNAQNSYDPAGIIITPARIVEYYWNFGDGTIVSWTEPTVTHWYFNGGNYHVTLTVKDNDHAIAFQTQTIRVNFPPVANFYIYRITPQGKQDFLPKGIIPQPNFRMGFDGSLSNDSDGKIVKYDWTFWDENKATGIQIEHYYPVQPGVYFTTLTVTDNDGGKATVAKKFEFIRVFSWRRHCLRQLFNCHRSDL